MNAQRGVALIMWMFIVLLVFFAIAAVLGYTQFEQNTELRDELELERLKVEQAEANLTKRIQERRDRDEILGFGGSATTMANLDTTNDQLARLRGKFPTVTEADTTLEAALTGVEKAYDDMKTSAANWKGQYEAAKQAEQAATDEAQAIADQKDSEIDQLNADLDAEKARAARAQGQAQDTIDQQRNRISTLESSIADLTETTKREKNELTNQLMAMDARIEEINTRNRIIREKSGPDGTVVNADEALGLVYLDIGAEHGLKRGTPFKVWSYGKGKQKVAKGTIEVREVRGDYAVAGVTSTVDPLNPIGKGDKVSNVYFDRGKAPEFVFLGQIPGRYNNEEAARILRSRGAVVADKVTANTDFLVVGRQATSSGTEEELEDSEPFKRAVLYGVELLRGEELVQYIQY